jgi:hypothetical protein
MSTSIVAVGASADLEVRVLERWGANAEERSEAIFSFDQVAVMLSLKSLRGKGSANCALSRCGGSKAGGDLRILDNEHVVLVSETEQHAALDQLLLSCFS